ncbi:MAG: type II secretion system ATPase GspE [Pseudomonadota bacterium]
MQEQITVEPVILEPQADAPDEESQQQKRLSYSFSRRFGLILDDESDEQVIIARPDYKPRYYAEVRRLLATKTPLRVVDEQQFNRLLQSQQEQNATSAMSDVEGLDSELDLHRLVDEIQEPEDLLESADDAPIIRLINALLTEAIRNNASDIHIEPYEKRLRIRFRVDGSLKEVLQPERKLALPIISRIKVMAKLDIAEKRLPQDGRISLKLGGRAVDVRVSTIPSANAEKVVMRLLDKQAGRLELKHLGMPEAIRRSIEYEIQQPHGIFLVTGPTGSGKTTSLYAMLGNLNDQVRNIMTVEDPIEYYIDGINQTQVKSSIGMTFAAGLRSILRQDPDVIMVGEIRDLETAEIAVQASLTGHMVFSTLHTNTAIGAITRMRDMGVEPFLLSSSLNAVMAQRLVRLLCEDCREGSIADQAECQLMSIGCDEAPLIYKAKGCRSCNYSGYYGRTGIYEFIHIDRKLQRLIHSQASEQEMLEHSRTKSDTLQQMGLQLVLDGRTSLDEVVRVAGLEDDTAGGVE